MSSTPERYLKNDDPGFSQFDAKAPCVLQETREPGGRAHQRAISFGRRVNGRARTPAHARDGRGTAPGLSSPVERCVHALSVYAPSGGARAPARTSSLWRESRSRDVTVRRAFVTLPASTIVNWFR